MEIATFVGVARRESNEFSKTFLLLKARDTRGNYDLYGRNRKNLCEIVGQLEDTRILRK